MLTGKLPKEEKAAGKIWKIIEKCIRLNPEERYSDDELITVLGQELGERDACIIVAVNHRKYDLGDIDEILENQGLTKLSKEIE